MIKIVKPGRLPDVVYFICENCGCEFEADNKRDIVVEKNQTPGIYKKSRSYYECICPSCDHMCYKSVL